LKVLIVDDERHARLLIKAILEDVCPEVTIVGEAEDLSAGVKLIHKHKPDLILLDIEMPGHSGLEILDFFDPEDIAFQIVFVTAYSDYAVKAFEVSAVDYLLKPLEAGSLKKAIDKVAKRIQLKEPTTYGQLQKALGAPLSQRIGIPDGHEIVFADTSELLYFDAAGAYTHVHLANNRKITTSKKLKFLRIHRGYLINLNHVVKYSRTEGGSVELSDGTMVPVSREKISILLEKLEGL
jgi:two-component system, LytTR family, response regulator